MADDDPNDCLTDGYYDCNLCPCNFTASTFVMTLLFSLISLFCSFVLVVGHLAIPEIGEQPGDIVFGIAISNIVFTITMIIDCSTDTTFTAELVPDTTACIALSYIKMMAMLLIDFYHWSFCIFYHISLNSSLKIRKKPKYFYHLFPLIGASAALGIFAGLDAMGRNIYGYCGNKTVPDIIVPLLMYDSTSIILVIFSLLTFRLIPKNERINALRTNFLKFYFKTIIALVLCYILNGIVDSISGSMTVAFLNDQTDEIPLSGLKYTKIFKSILMVFTPLILILARFTDPSLKEHWKSMFLACWNKYKVMTTSRHLTPPEERKVSIDLVTLQRSLAKKSDIVQLQHSLRVQVVYSLLSAIHYFWRTKQEKNVFSYSAEMSGSSIDLDAKTMPSSRRLLGKNYEREAQFKEYFSIDKDLMTKSIPEVFDEIKGKQYNFAAGTFTVYAPGIFEEIIELDNTGRNIKRSLDLKENFNRILKSGINGGGKSGEFFFFSNDNRIILKTVSHSELKTLLNILPSYLNHFKSNPESLIAKIYGVFTLTVATTNEKYNLILMRNINGLPTVYVKRKYDLKGSTVHRRAIRDEKVPFSELFLYPNLKDLDFERYEKKLNISNNMSSSLLETLKKDVAFLASQNLIDYSLAVYIVDKEKYLKKLKRMSQNFNEKDHADSDSIDPNLKAKLESLECNKHLDDKYISIKSSKEDYYYHVGLIDYLVPFNMKKKVERFVKTIAVCKPKKDISIQKPEYYGQRMLKFVEKLLI